MRRSYTLTCIRAAVLALPLGIACSSSNNGNPGLTDGGANNGSGGENNSSGGNGGSSGNGGNSGSGGNSGNGSSTGSGGNNGNGSSGNGNGGNSGGNGSGSGAGGSSNGGNGSGSSSGNNGGSTGGSSSSGGTSNGGPAGDAGASMCGTPGIDVISDFEQDTGSMIDQGGRTGWWYVYADTVAAGTQTPAANATGPITVTAAPSDDKVDLAGETCNKYALHSTASGHTQYTGVGATFVPLGGTNKSPYDLTKFDGIQMDIKGMSAAQQLYFELLTEESQPTTYGGTIPAVAAGATDPNGSITTNNNRGYVFAPAGTTDDNTSTSIPTAMTTVYVPFSILIPRHFPSPGTAATDCGSIKCEAPAFNPAHALGFQFSAYPDMGNATGSYDLYIDNVALYTGDNGLLPPGMTMPTFNDGAAGFSSCKAAIPTFAGTRTAAGKYLMWAYSNWKSRFYKGGTIIRPENGNDTVSEGIGYGMLLAVYFNDETLFDSLWSYEQGHKAVSNLMTWCIPSGGGSCSANGGGTATDADEDMAFALIEAGKLWGKTYAATASGLISDIYTNDIDWTGQGLPKGGSNYAVGGLTNPSYFAPAYYHEFAQVDTANASKWTGLETNVISVINALASGDGLVPAWCTTNCTVAASNGASTDTIYQYDAHRVPWRVGLDYCWWGTASAASYLGKIKTFFSGLAASGIDSIYDEYQLSGTPATSASPPAEPNSMSIVGAAAVGAMSGGSSAFVNSAWQFVLDGGNRAALDGTATAASTHYAYSYYNATLGLMTALTMSGNFYPM